MARQNRSLVGSLLLLIVSVLMLSSVTAGLAVAGPAAGVVAQADDTPTLQSGEVVNGTAQDGNVVEYLLPVTEAGLLVTIVLTPLDAEADLGLVAGTAQKEVQWLSDSTASQERLIFQAPEAGDYLILVIADGDGGDYSLVADVRLPTPLPVEPIPSAGTASAIIFQEDFEGDGGYFGTDTGDGWVAEYKDGAYTITLDDSSGYVYNGTVGGENIQGPELILDEPEMQNVRVSIDSTVEQLTTGATYGIVCGLHEGSREFYALMVSADGRHYTISDRSNWQILAGQDWGKAHPAIHTGQGATNHIEAICADTEMSLYANGEMLTRVALDKGPIGGIGVIVGTEEAGPASVSFDNLVVETLPAIEITQGSYIETEFDQDDAVGWPAGVGITDADTAIVEDGSLVVTVAPDGSFWQPLGWLKYGDAAVDVTFSILSGSPGTSLGVDCRTQSDGGYYQVQVNPNGGYAFWKQVGEDGEWVQGLTPSDALHSEAGATNRIRVECVDDAVRLSINGEVVDEWNDETLTVGYLAIWVIGDSAATEDSVVAIDRITVQNPLLEVENPTATDMGAVDGELIFVEDFDLGGKRDSGYMSGYTDEDGTALYDEDVFKIIVENPFKTVFGFTYEEGAEGISGPVSDDLILSPEQLTNVSVEVDAAPVPDGEGDLLRGRYGIICGMQRDETGTKERYALYIDATGQDYGISYYQRSSGSLILAGQTWGDPHPAIKTEPGAVNHLRAECADTGLVLYVNGEKLVEFPLDGAPMGRLGLIAESLFAPFEVEFDNMMVQQLAELPPVADPESGSVIYSDDFSSDLSGLYRGKGEGFAVGYADDGTYAITLEPGKNGGGKPGGVTIADTSISVDVAQVEGAGQIFQTVISCRVMAKEMYTFVVTAGGEDAGTFLIGKVVGGERGTVVAKTESDAIKTGLGEVNHLQAECIGNLLRLHINDELVAEVEDNDVAGNGTISLTASSNPNNTEKIEIRFDNLRIEYR